MYCCAICLDEKLDDELDNSFISPKCCDYKQHFHTHCFKLFVDSIKSKTGFSDLSSNCIECPICRKNMNCSYTTIPKPYYNFHIIWIYIKYYFHMMQIPISYIIVFALMIEQLKFIEHEMLNTLIASSIICSMLYALDIAHLMKDFNYINIYIISRTYYLIMDNYVIPKIYTQKVILQCMHIITFLVLIIGIIEQTSYSISISITYNEIINVTHKLIKHNTYMSIFYILMFISSNIIFIKYFIFDTIYDATCNGIQNNNKLSTVFDVQYLINIINDVSIIYLYYSVLLLYNSLSLYNKYHKYNLTETIKSDLMINIITNIIMGVYMIKSFNISSNIQYYIWITISTFNIIMCAIYIAHLCLSCPNIKIKVTKEVNKLFTIDFDSPFLPKDHIKVIIEKPIEKPISNKQRKLLKYREKRTIMSQKRKEQKTQ